MARHCGPHQRIHSSDVEGRRGLELVWKLLALDFFSSAHTRNFRGGPSASGLSRKDATILGVLMNTRGLVELIVLNIGLSLGILSPTLFTMLVIMALVTTFMTGPWLRWIGPRSS
jgi:Kef-type K+ transport system membrane component KefB